MFKDYAQLPRSVYVLCLGTLINRAGTFLVPFLTLYLTEQLGLSEAFATTAMGAFGLGAIFAAMTGGHFADTIGRRAVMVFALVGGAAVLVAISFAQSSMVILLLLIAFGFVSEMYRPAVHAMIADLVPPKQRAHAYGMVYLSINLGFAVAPLIAGVLISIGYRLLFWGDAATACVYAGILFACIAETRPKVTGGAQTTAGSADDVRCGDGGGPDGSIEAAARHMVRDRTMMLFCLAMLLAACVFTQSLSTLPLFLREKGIDAVGYGKIIAVNGIMIVLFQMPMTAIVTRFNRAWVMVVSMLTMSLGYGLIGLGEGAGYFAMTVVVWTLAEMMQVPFMSAIVADLSPVHLRARYMGLLTMSFAIALFVGVPLGGRVLTAWGGAWLWGGCAGLAAVAAVLLFVIRRAIEGASSESRS